MSKLAINGGSPVRTAASSPWPVYGPEEEKALSHVVYAGEWGTLGHADQQFAQEFTQYVGTDYGMLVSSGTVALELILRSLGIGYGDEVIVPAYTFVATVSAVGMVGATPVLADIELPTCNIDPLEIERLITDKTKAVIVVHIGGHPCKMENIMAIAKRHGIYVIEDAAHAHGGKCNGKRLGAIGNAGSFSFQSSKNLTAGEGGAIMTDSRSIYENCWRYHHSGRAISGSSEFGGLVLLGSNARITEFQASVLSEQLKRLDDQVTKRNANARYLREKLQGIAGLSLPPEADDHSLNAYHLFTLLLEQSEYMNRDRWLASLNDQGIPAYAGYTNLAKMGFLDMKNENFRKSTASTIDYAALRLHNTELAVASAIWLHGSVLLGEQEDMDHIAKGFWKASEAVSQR